MQRMHVYVSNQLQAGHEQLRSSSQSVSIRCCSPSTKQQAGVHILEHSE
jgi:hypothetical protein